jgi:hypothetical protein
MATGTNSNPKRFARKTSGRTRRRGDKRRKKPLSNLIRIKSGLRMERQANPKPSVCTPTALLLILLQKPTRTLRWSQLRHKASDEDHVRVLVRGRYRKRTTSYIFLGPAAMGGTSFLEGLKYLYIRCWASWSWSVYSCALALGHY